MEVTVVAGQDRCLPGTLWTWREIHRKVPAPRDEHILFGDHSTSGLPGTPQVC